MRRCLRSNDGARRAEVLADECLHKLHAAGLIDGAAVITRCLVHTGKVHIDDADRGVMQRVLQIVDDEPEVL
jgi:hypothetical protein